MDAVRPTGGDAATNAYRVQKLCIIGAGIAGFSTAYKLVSRQHEVVLIEAREVLSGETWKPHFGCPPLKRAGRRPEEHDKDVKKLKEEAELDTKLKLEAEFREVLAV
ncbi:FAD dependent oxidoreductase [Diaporthe helianthi]|uniref:FAD dependent oxidoreductase n=1 Tax=Diaporthe helianthi TaxID=158607 RepID=A0A2P5I217_DIAHE|nr:FAD dependent oxidoreductase [Diaporthe helianthi]